MYRLRPMLFAFAPCLFACPAAAQPLAQPVVQALASVTPAPTATPRSGPELTWTPSLDGNILTNPVRFPTHRGFVVLHISEHQADGKSGAPYTLSVLPHCAELARKTTNDEVLLMPFNDGMCALTVTDTFGASTTANLYVGGQAISAYIQAIATPSPTPSPTATATPVSDQLNSFFMNS
jgi:hypothetical protein